ncbi:MAG TPA: carboxypeptidase-like regulatory domain-containing protein, partial [Terracidiphilus sp.]|nr:carboxypeptidase-like regulatory domain-containing protein [Terracidiphilus sp.]
MHGTVTDPSGAVIPGASVQLSNAISGLNRTVTTDGTGSFEFDNVPFNNYHLTVSATGFSHTGQTVSLTSAVGVSLKVILP